MEDNSEQLNNIQPFSINRRYFTGDLVVYLGSVYTALNEVDGEFPIFSEDWENTQAVTVDNSELLAYADPELMSMTQWGTTHNAANYATLYTTNTLHENTLYGSASQTNMMGSLQLEIDMLRNEIAQIKKDLKVARAKEEKEHRKLSV